MKGIPVIPNEEEFQQNAHKLSEERSVFGDKPDHPIGRPIKGPMTDKQKYERYAKANITHEIVSTFKTTCGKRVNWNTKTVEKGEAATCINCKKRIKSLATKPCR